MSQARSIYRGFGDCIRDARHKEGITMKRLAKRVGLNSGQQVYQWEQGIAPVPPRRMTALLRAIPINKTEVKRRIARNIRIWA